MEAEFRLFGPQHLAVLLSLSLLCMWMARRAMQMSDAHRRRLGWLLGSVLLAFALTVYGQQALSGGFDAAYSLPMELCDWVLGACLVALFHPNILASEVAYFWGSAGILQALLTPDINRGFPSWQFVAFFWGHGTILLAIVFVIAARRLRIRPGNILRMMIVLNIYGLVAFSIDLAFGWNYGYLLHKPLQPTLFDFLGPWPWYLVSIEAVALASFWLLNLLAKRITGLEIQSAIPKR